MINLKNIFKPVMCVLSLYFSLLNIGVCSTLTHDKHGENSLSVLSAVSQDVKTYGDMIYKGDVFKLNGKHTSPLYVYERRVRSDGLLIISTSFTHDEHNVALIEVATHDAAFQLKEYTEYQFQLGEVGSVIVSGTTVQFRLLSGDAEKKAQESVSLPVVVGPTLYGFVYQNWERLLAGDSVDFRFAVVSRLETVGFVLQKVASSDNLVRIRMKAKSPLIALIVDPIYINFSSDRSIVSLEGRVPTKLKQGERWVDLDAFVKYDNKPASIK